MEATMTRAGIQTGARQRYQPPQSTHELTPASVLGKMTATELLWAPPMFWVAGDAALLATGVKRVAIVGSRDASDLGLRRAEKLARQLAAAGVVVVSGLAKGIDCSSHEGAINAGGRTIAVIGTPLDKCYPAEHARLQQEIYEHHLLVSQFQIDRRVFPSNFVERNRFMALIAHVSVIVEAGDGSGTLSQAAEAQRLGRPLFIMKSVLENKDLGWPHRFLDRRDGRPATILEDVGQILSLL